MEKVIVFLGLLSFVFLGVVSYKNIKKLKIMKDENLDS